MPNYTPRRAMGRSHWGHRRGGRYVTKGYLKSVIGTPEVKFFDVTRPINPVTAAGLVLGLNDNVTAGVGPNSRIGTEVSNKSLHIRMSMARGAVDSFLRIIVFWYLDGSVGAGTITNILQTAAYDSPLNKLNGKSFWVKYDCTFTLAAGQTQLQTEEIYRQLRCKTEYDNTTNIPLNNSLGILYISNQTVAANQPLLQLYSRLTYLDV